jgi:hypothetical protein
MPETAALRAVIAAESSGLRGCITLHVPCLVVFSSILTCIDFSFYGI